MNQDMIKKYNTIFPKKKKKNKINANPVAWHDSEPARGATFLYHLNNFAKKYIYRKDVSRYDKEYNTLFTTKKNPVAWHGSAPARGAKLSILSITVISIISSSFLNTKKSTKAEQNKRKKLSLFYWILGLA